MTLALTFTLALALTLAFATPTQAQPAASEAGLVIRFGDGRVVTRCVALPEGGLTGVELLERSGLDLALKVDALGALVCRIEQEGCPREDCLCQCRSLGGGCRYWAYHSLHDGRWRYEQSGPADRRLVAGDVDGWAWGAGSVSAGAEPPSVTFAEICTPPTATALPAATVVPKITITSSPSAAAPATVTGRATVAPAPTATRPRSVVSSPTARPTDRSVGTRAASTPGASSIGSATPARTPAFSADRTSDAGPAARERLATLEAFATQLAALEAIAAARTDGQEPLITAPGSGADTGNSAADPGAADRDPRPAPITGDPVALHPPAAVSIPLPSSSSPARPPVKAPGIPWLALGVLAVLGLAWWRGRRSGA